ncbi:hypothetical protein M413DRAFT_259744 [Hebeloma cylindrosporum]|uniref:Uncharacterized protein n=1 Tax=Hebeloma cylindrosporum TaxID=76867 RepID=A0A0C3CRE0_HEBCY|nr:hypothetical protein M413DRAFT_259744 [Hebeloma cylindrosporum h7]
MQFAEYFLDHCSRSGISEDPIEKAKQKDSELHLTFHLFQALPSERIYANLRTIYRLKLLRSPGSLIDSMRGIVTWLEGQSRPPLDIYIKWQKEILEEEAYELEKSKCELAPATPSRVSLMIRKAVQWWLSFRVDWEQLNWRIFIFFERLSLAIYLFLTGRLTFGFREG